MDDLSPERQADMLAYWMFHHPTEPPKGKPKQAPSSPHQSMVDAWAEANTPREWARRTGSTPEAIAWATSGDD